MSDSGIRNSEPFFLGSNTRRLLSHVKKRRDFRNPVIVLVIPVKREMNTAIITDKEKEVSTPLSTDAYRLLK